LPKSISECGDVLFGGFVNASCGTVRDPGFLMRLLREQVSLIGVLECLSGAFMSGQVIFFSVALGPGPMCVGSKVTVLSSYLL
jgi:hypothetical protein